MGNASEAVFIEAESPHLAIDSALPVFNKKKDWLGRDRNFGHIKAEPIQLRELTECDGWEP